MFEDLSKSSTNFNTFNQLVVFATSTQIYSLGRQFIYLFKTTKMSQFNMEKNKVSKIFTLMVNRFIQKFIMNQRTIIFSFSFKTTANISLCQRKLPQFNLCLPIKNITILTIEIDSIIIKRNYIHMSYFKNNTTF